MTTEEYLKLHIGTFVYNIAVLQGENDKLKAELANKSAPTPPTYE